MRYSVFLLASTLDFISLLIVISFALYPQTTLAYSQPRVPPVLVAIAVAESGGRQYDANGNLLCDGVTHTHCGIYQIGIEHAKQAKSMGWDITTPEGNTAEALWLYDQAGTAPWKASEFDSTNPNAWGKYYYKDGTPKGGQSG